MSDPLGIAVLFLVIALVAWMFRAREMIGFSIGIARFLIVIFVVRFIISP